VTDFVRHAKKAIIEPKHRSGRSTFHKPSRTSSVWQRLFETKVRQIILLILHAIHDSIDGEWHDPRKRRKAESCPSRPTSASTHNLPLDPDAKTLLQQRTQKLSTVLLIMDADAKKECSARVKCSHNHNG
jgi:hypothetical protein